MLAVFFERKQGMSMMEELTVIVSHNITVERYQFQHSFQPFSFKTASFGDEHLQLCTLTATYPRENG